MPLVVATVGGTATSRGRAVLLSVSFAVGLALCFTALGAVAALTGSLIGDIGPWWKIILGVILVVMGLHLSGMLRLPVPTLDGRRFRGAGPVGAFGLGALTLGRFSAQILIGLGQGLFIVASTCQAAHQIVGQ